MSNRFVFQVFVWFIFGSLQFISIVLPTPLIANIQNSNQESLSTQQSLNILQSAIDRITEQLDLSQQNVVDLPKKIKHYLTNDMAYRIQTTQTFGSHVERCLAQDGFLLYDPNLISNIENPPSKILVATFNTRLLLGQSVEQAVASMARHESDCAIVSPSGGGADFSAESANCVDDEHHAICQYSTGLLTREAYLEHKYVKPAFIDLAKSISDNLQLLKLNLAVSPSYVNDLGHTLTAAGNLSLKLDNLTSTYPLQYNLLLETLLIDQYITQVSWLNDQSHIQPLQQHLQSNNENDLLKSTQIQINNQLETVTAHYHSLAEQVTELKSYSVQMAKLEQHLQELKSEQAKLEISLTQLNLRSVSTQLQERTNSQPQSKQEASGVAVDDDFNFNSLNSQLEGLGYTRVENQTVQIWPFSYYVQIDTYYKINFINFYCAASYAWFMMIIFTYTCIIARVKDRRVNLLQRDIDALRENLNQSFKPRKQNKRRQSRPIDPQTPLLSKNLPNRDNLLKAIHTKQAF